MNVLPGELRVDPQVLDSCGQRLAVLAGSLPPAPVGFSAVAGGDPLSAVAFTQQQAAEAPVLMGIAKVGGPHITVSGHSYGSTAVADAAAGYGMRADDIVLLGCPGTDMAHNAADFHLPDGGHVYVGAASGDPISHIGEAFMTPPPLGLGADLAIDGFGSTRFKAEFSGIQFDHSHYYDLGSESLYSLTTIAGGNGESLQDLEMTAPHRSGIPAAVGAVLPTDNPLIPDILERPLNQIVTGMAFDPETTRPATGGHQYGP